MLKFKCNLSLKNTVFKALSYLKQERNLEQTNLLKGHVALLHMATSISSPGQFKSSLLDTEQFRLRVVSPPPQVFVQAVHELHSCQPSPGGQNDYKNIVRSIYKELL